MVAVPNILWVIKCASFPSLPPGIHSCLQQACCLVSSPQPSWLLESASNASCRSEDLITVAPEETHPVPDDWMNQSNEIETVLCVCLCVCRSRHHLGKWSMLDRWTVWNSCTKNLVSEGSTKALLWLSWEVPLYPEPEHMWHIFAKLSLKLSSIINTIMNMVAALTAGCMADYS